MCVKAPELEECQISPPATSSCNLFLEREESVEAGGEGSLRAAQAQRGRRSMWGRESGGQDRTRRGSPGPFCHERENTRPREEKTHKQTLHSFPSSRWGLPWREDLSAGDSFGVGQGRPGGGWGACFRCIGRPWGLRKGGGAGPVVPVPVSVVGAQGGRQGRGRGSGSKRPRT